MFLKKSKVLGSCNLFSLVRSFSSMKAVLGGNKVSKATSNAQTESSAPKITLNDFYKQKEEFKTWLENMKNDPTFLKKKDDDYEPILKPKRKLFYNNMEEEINRKFSVTKVTPSNVFSKRSGVLGYKVGMTGVWDKWGTYFPLTVIKIDRCQVIHVKRAKTGFIALQVGCGSPNPRKLKKPQLGQFIKAGVPAKKDIKEFAISPENELPVGFVLGPRHFTLGQYVNVRALTKGKGFQGVMRRWNFAGGVASHGNSLKHRAGGSIGNRTKPGRVWPGKKMAGRMGNTNHVVENLLVYKIDHEKSLLYLKGAVPGHELALVQVFDSFKRARQNSPILNYPTFVAEKGKTYPLVSEFEGTEDLSEKFTHDNDEVLGVSDEEDESKGYKELEDDDESAMKKEG